MAERVLPHGLLRMGMTWRGRRPPRCGTSTSGHGLREGGRHQAAQSHHREYLCSALLAAPRGGPCRVYTEPIKLRVEDVIYYPGVMVACGPEGEDEDPLIEEAPCLVVEVASPSTESIDRREKMLAYRSIPSLRA